MLQMKMPASKEIFFSVEDPDFASDYFRMYEFKVKRCPRAKPHDWTLCPFSHPGEKAKRRDPKRYRYSGTACPEFRKNACCRRGDACPFAHGVFECWLHPSRYRTQLCTDGPGCKRRVCFFAHLEEELRKPDDDPLMLNSGADYGLLGAMDMDKLHAMTNLLQLNPQVTVASGLSEQAAPMADANQELLKSLTSGHSSPLPPTANFVDNNNNSGAQTPSSIQTQIKMLQIQQQILELQELEKQQQESQSRQQQLIKDVMTQLGPNQLGGGEGDMLQALQQQKDDELFGMVKSLQLQQEQGVAPIMASEPMINLIPTVSAMPASPTVQRSEHSHSSQGSGFMMPSSPPISSGLPPLTSSPSLSPVHSSSQLNLPPLAASEEVASPEADAAQVDEFITLLASQVNQQEDIGKLLHLLKATGTVHPNILSKISSTLLQEGRQDVGVGSLGERCPSQPDMGSLVAPPISVGIMSGSLSSPSLPIPASQLPPTSMPEVTNIWSDVPDDKFTQALVAAVKDSAIASQHHRNSSLDQILNELPRSMSDLKMADASLHGSILAPPSSQAP